MNNISNRRIYRFLAPTYDLFFQSLFAGLRRYLLLSLDLQPGGRLLGTAPNRAWEQISTGILGQAMWQNKATGFTASTA